MFNGGMVAATLPKADLDEVFATFAGKDTDLAVDLSALTLTFSAPGVKKTYGFSLGEFEKALVREGGWVGYAAAHY
jgi:3-isopropylmalate/(R)-2-methylmalate dehydratase small subunit